MDKMFMMQKDYLTDDEGLERIIRKYSSRNLDHWMIVDSIDKISEQDQEKIERLKMEVIPVGDIKFIKAWLHKMYGDNMMEPLEVPESLRRFLGRGYKLQLGNEIDKQVLEKGSAFVKNASKLKDWNNLLYKGMDITDKINPDDLYVVSSWVDFRSEFRVFVMDDEVKACQNYLGYPLLFPDARKIEKMVHEYSKGERPDAYTLDIGVWFGELGEVVTDIIEVHPFAACGLYGFSEKEILPMLVKGYHWYVDKIKEKKVQKK